MTDLLCLENLVFTKDELPLWKIAYNPRPHAYWHSQTFIFIWRTFMHINACNDFAMVPFTLSS